MGAYGFNHYNWQYKTFQDKDEVTVELSQVIHNEVDGFPGDMIVTVSYTLNNANRLDVTYRAYDITADTLFNPTNHIYFNLSKRQDLLTHELQLNSKFYLETQADLIPTGRLLPVDNTPYDFRKTKNLGQAVQRNNGFDDAFLVGQASEEPIAVLSDSDSGDTISIFLIEMVWSCIH